MKMLIFPRNEKQEQIPVGAVPPRCVPKVFVLDASVTHGLCTHSCSCPARWTRHTRRPPRSGLICSLVALPAGCPVLHVLCASNMIHTFTCLILSTAKHKKSPEMCLFRMAWQTWCPLDSSCLLGTLRICCCCQTIRPQCSRDQGQCCLRPKLLGIGLLLQGTNKKAWGAGLLWMNVTSRSSVMVTFGNCNISINPPCQKETHVIYKIFLFY